MRYCVPVNAADEVAALAAAGADELYCGYQDRWWEERYGNHDSASRRQGRANLATLGELDRTVTTAREAGISVQLALNSRYTEPQLDHLVGLCDTFAEMGGAGVIVSDLGLLWRLRDRPRLARTVSLLAVVQNVPTLEAYARLGVTRVVFPRFVSHLEAGALLQSVPGMQGEVMAFFDKCPLVDGYCRHRHGVTYLDRDAAADDDAPPLYSFDTTYRTHACLGTRCTYLHPYPCAACELRSFAHAHVAYAKLGGRGRPLEERLRAVRFLKRAETLGDDESRKRLYRQTFGVDCVCYYGDDRQKRWAIEPLPCADDGGQRYLGSQTSLEVFVETIARIRRHGAGATDRPITLLVPPLDQPHVVSLAAALPELSAILPEGTHLCVNDLGTFVKATQLCRTSRLGLTVTMGTLLARTDDPREVAHALSPEENPSRPIWGPTGEPRTLTYRPPSPELQRHWSHPSSVEPSAQEALRVLTGEPEIRCERF